MGQHNIIELNGKQYDALTGALLGESRIAATPVTKATHLMRQGRNMDGFIRKKPANNLKSVVIKPAAAKATPDEVLAIAATPVTPRPKQTKSVGGIKAAGTGGGHRTAKTLAHHQPEKPKTLMRHVVKKPKATMKPAIKTTAPAEMMARPKSTLAKPLEKKMSVTQVNPVRLGRARQIPKSHHVQRFNASKRQTATGEVQIAQGGAAPVRPPQYTARPVRQDFRPGAAATPVMTANSVATTGNNQNTPNTAQVDSTDIFEAALAHATSHEQQSPVLMHRRQARRKRLVNVMAGLGAFLVIAGFLAYLNRPAIELRVASMRAGFHAEMPSYKPTGYALAGGVKTSNGRVAMQFRSGENSYWITQEASDWNSSTLLDQSSEQRGAPTRTIQSKGRTIYIYNDTSATWVNGGVRYEINGNSSLDTSELVSLATSM